MLTKRVMAATAVTLAVFLFAPAARPAADDGSTKKTPTTANEDASAPMDEKPASKDPGSPVEAELQQLRNALVAEQATLQAQQERINYLESQLRAAPAGAATSVSASTAEPATNPMTLSSTGNFLQPAPAQSGGTVQTGGKRNPVSPLRSVQPISRPVAGLI